jgi:hypothetical protein
MVSLTLKHNIQWQAPMPIWAESSSTGIRITNESLAPYPSILRFASDGFMQDMLDVMDNNPKRIAEWLAQPETWREPMQTPTPAPKKSDDDGIAFLFNKTKQLTDELKHTAKTRPAKAELANVQQAVHVAEKARAGAAPIKLFQSTHQRFYLVSASLISSAPGYPDQALDLSNQEKATFVVRRLVPPTDQNEEPDIDTIGEWDEYAFIVSGEGAKWLRVAQSKSLACKKLLALEEQLPLFPVNYKDSCKHDRTVLSGLVPVGKRESWMAAAVANSVSGIDPQANDAVYNSGLSHARVMFMTEVTEPWKILVEQAEFKKQGLARRFDSFDTSGSSSGETDNARRTHRDNIQMASWYVLLDFAKFLEKYLPALWRVAATLTTDASLQITDFELDENEAQLLSSIQNTRLSNNVIDALIAINDQYLDHSSTNKGTRRDAAIEAGSIKVSLLDALLAIIDLETDLEQVASEFNRFSEFIRVDGINDIQPESLQVDEKWPGFLFPLADPEFDGPTPDNTAAALDLESRLLKIDELADLVEKILPEAASSEELFNPKNVLDQRDAWFVIRCVYERPHCGPLFPALVSAPTRVFQMAPFFDPDAPARPIRIPMPVDISPAGLRKYKKNTAFVISDMLCGKIKKIRKITLGDLVLSVLPWPFHKDLPNPGDGGPCKQGGSGFGMICSLSIPIVTLCALILLMIMVALFDLFFRWIPFLFICLPIPGLKGKS